MRIVPESMSRYTERSVRMARWWLRAVGLLFVFSGIALLVSIGGDRVLVPLLIAIFGICLFLCSFMRSSNDVVDVAREHLKVDAED